MSCTFPIRPLLDHGLCEEEAVAATLQQAKAQREELVQKGVLQALALPEQGKASSVRGVTFHNASKKWRLELMDPATKKYVHGSFATQEDAETKASELVEEFGRQEDVVMVKKLSELKHFEPLGPQKGVRWRLGEQCWHAQIRVAGKNTAMRFRPEDFSEKEVEKSWKLAVAWRKQRETDQSKKRKVESMGVSTDSPPDTSEAHAVRAGPWHRLECQSGIPNISWCRHYARWRIQCKQAGKFKLLNVPIHPFLKKGQDEEQAVAAALRKAKTCRQKLARKGLLKPAKHIRGVRFDKTKQRWRVQLTCHVTKRSHYGGSFTTRKKAEAKARELAKDLGKQEDVVPVKKLSQLKHFEPLGLQKGVRWVCSEQCWRAGIKFSGQRKESRFRPRDLSEKEVKKAWKQAVAWRRQQEKDRGQVKKC